MKFTIYFAPSDSVRDGEAGIRMRIGTPSFSVFINTGYRIMQSAWNKEAQRVKRNTFHGKYKIPASVINEHLQRWESTAVSILAPAIDMERDVFREQFEIAVGKRVTKKVKDKTLFQYHAEFMIDQGTECSWSYATAQKHRAAVAHLKAFSDNKLTFEDLDESGFVKFSAWLISDAKLRNTTAKKVIANVKWFLRWAYKKGYCKQDKFNRYHSKLKVAKKHIVFLTWDELMQFYNFDFSTNRKLEVVRDVFCFCCFTGLRYSDVANLRRSNIVGDRLVLTTIKTTDTLSIELNKYSKALIAKYADYDGETAFPVMSNQKMNDYLKDAAEIAKLEEPVTDVYMKGGSRFEETHKKHEVISTHAGRRTFICNALTLGIPPEIVMQWTGHSDYKAMKPYIDVADSEKRNAMNKFNEK